jgi:hypothetical protein
MENVRSIMENTFLKMTCNSKALI